MEELSDLISRVDYDDYVEDYLELLEIVPDNDEAWCIIRDRVRAEYDQNIWDYVDSDENEEALVTLDFDDVLIAIVDDIESKVHHILDERDAV